MPHSLVLLAVRFCCAASLLLSGCHVLTTSAPTTDASILKAVSGSPEAVTLEIYWANLPADTGEEGEAFWRMIQESRLPADLRRRLARNGLRAGVLSGALPDQMHELLNPNGGACDDSTETTTVLRESGVWRRTRQLRPGDQLELKASEPKPSAPLLIARGEELVGEIFTNAQAFYRLETSVTRDGRSELSLTPEVRHGVAKPRWTPDETGAFAMATPTRDAEVFSELAIRAPLAAGESLLVTSLPNSDSRLGGYFHTAAQEAGRRKAILLRVVQASRTDDFSLDPQQLPVK